MIMVLLVVFDIIAIVFIGAFARSNSISSNITSYHPLFNNCAMLLLAFTLIYTPFRKFSLFSLGSLLIVIGTTVETYILFATFWDSCFQGFNSTFTVDTTLVVRSLFCSLAVVLTALDFIGIFCYWQAYLILAPIMAIGSALCGAILIRGLKIFDGGGGLLIFFYSGVCSLMIWLVLIKGQLPSSLGSPKGSYINSLLGMIGLILLLINWPKFNAAGALVSYFNVDTTTISVSYLQNSAITNTFMALAIAILLGFFFFDKADEGKKMSFRVYADCVINGGIAVASFQDVAIDPVVSLIIGGFASFITLLIERKLNEGAGAEPPGQFTKFMKNYGKVFYRLVFSFLGIIICSMVVGGRTSRNPSLLSGSYSKIAGFQIVGWLIVLGLGAVFGGISALLIRVFLTSKEVSKDVKEPVEVVDKNKLTSAQQKFYEARLQLEDGNYFQLNNDETMPLYFDMFSNIKEITKDNYAFVKHGDQMKEVLMAETANPLRLMLLQKNLSSGRPAQSQQPPLVISKSYTKDNLHKIVAASEMKRAGAEKGEDPMEEDINYHLPLESKKMERQKKPEQQAIKQENSFNQPSNKPAQSLKRQPTFNKGRKYQEDLNDNSDPLRSYSSDIKEEHQMNQSGMVPLKSNILMSNASKNRLAGQQGESIPPALTGTVQSGVNIRMTGSRFI